MSLTSDTAHPNDVDHKCEAQKQNLAFFPVQVNRQCSSKVIEKVTIRNEDGNCSKYYNDCTGGSNTAENREVGEKSGEDEDQCPLLQVDEEEGETEKKKYFKIF